MHILWRMEKVLTKPTLNAFVSSFKVGEVVVSKITGIWLILASFWDVLDVKTFLKVKDKRL